MKIARTDRPWTTQPFYPARLNPGLREPTSVWLGSLPGHNLAAVERPVMAGGAITVASGGMIAAGFPSASGVRIRLTDDVRTMFAPPAGSGSPSVPTEGTIAILRRSKDTTARACTLFGFDGGGSTHIFCAAPYSDGNLYFDFGNSTSGVGRLSFAFAKKTTWETLIFGAGDRGMEVWRDGVLIGSDPNATPGYALFTALPFDIGGVGSPADEDEVALFVTSRAQWTRAECQLWGKQPFAATFAPRQVWFPVTAAAGAVFNPLTGRGGAAAQPLAVH